MNAASTRLSERDQRGIRVPVVSCSVSYDPNAFRSLYRSPSDDELKTAVESARAAVLRESAGDCWVILDVEADAALDARVNLIVAVPDGPDHRVRLHEAVERFERKVTARIGGFVNRGLRVIEAHSPIAVARC